MVLLRLILPTTKQREYLMPETIVWNKKLLVVSLILGVLAVALFYLYMVRV